MSKQSDPENPGAGIPLAAVRHVRDACLCLHAQRAARALARRFDRALAPAGLTNGQFSLMMALSGLGVARQGHLAELLAMDRTSLTAMVKPLARRGWVQVEVDAKDRRGRQLCLSDPGRSVLAEALTIWQREHAAVESTLPDPDALRAGLNALAFAQGEEAGPPR